jgi:hypothetical protein
MVHLVYRLRMPEVAKRLNRLYQMVQTMETRSVSEQVESSPPARLLLSPTRRALDTGALAADYTSGGSLRELAAKYGIDRKTVALQLRKSGIALRLPGSNLHRGPLFNRSATN